LPRQADIFTDIVTLQSKIGRDPAERAAREASRGPRDDRGIGEPGQHPAFLQRPPMPQRAGAGAPVDDDEESFE